MSQSICREVGSKGSKVNNSSSYTAYVLRVGGKWEGNENDFRCFNGDLLTHTETSQTHKCAILSTIYGVYLYVQID